MKRKKQYIISVVVLITIIIIYFVSYKNRDVELIVPFDKNYNQETIVPKQEIKIEQIEKKENTIKPIIDSDSLKVSLVVLDRKYDVSVKEGSSIFTAMEKIQKEGNFSFKYTETKGLGNFITEINGLKGTPGKYWVYYVNNKKASIGASNNILKEGDIIRWAQEGL